MDEIVWTGSELPTRRFGRFMFRAQCCRKNPAASSGSRRSSAAARTRSCAGTRRRPTTASLWRLSACRAGLIAVRRADRAATPAVRFLSSAERTHRELTWPRVLHEQQARTQAAHAVQPHAADRAQVGGADRGRLAAGAGRDRHSAGSRRMALAAADDGARKLAVEEGRAPAAGNRDAIRRRGPGAPGPLARRFRTGAVANHRWRRELDRCSVSRR